jgi:hypothetical protein
MSRVKARAEALKGYTTEELIEALASRFRALVISTRTLTADGEDTVSATWKGPPVECMGLAAHVQGELMRGSDKAEAMVSPPLPTLSIAKVAHDGGTDDPGS